MASAGYGLMIRLAQYDKAQQICDIMLNETADETERVYIYNYLGIIRHHQRNYTDAITFHEKSMAIVEKMYSANDPILTTFYSNIISVYDYMGEYSKALSYSEKLLEIQQKALPLNHPDFASIYNNIALVYH